MIEEDRTVQHKGKFELCFCSLANLSLVRAVHEIMWSPGNVQVLIKQIEELLLLIKDDDSEESFKKIKANYKRYLSAMRALSNCLVSNNTVLTFEDPSFKPIANDLIEIFELFNDWKKMSLLTMKLLDMIEADEEITLFFSKMQDESTLALFLVYTDVDMMKRQIEQNMPFHELESFKQIKYLMVLLKNNNAKNYDTHILTKAISVLTKFHCRTSAQSKLLYFSDVLGCLAKIMAYNEMSSSREAALLGLEIIRRPDDMVLWLKFASDRLSINSACTEDLLVQEGEPFRLPIGRGLYRDWGAFFDFNDVIMIPGGLALPGMIME